MIPDQYAWLAWASLFLIPWLLLYAAFPAYRRAMWWTSVFTMPFGLTERRTEEYNAAMLEGLDDISGAGTGDWLPALRRALAT